MNSLTIGTLDLFAIKARESKIYLFHVDLNKLKVLYYLEVFSVAFLVHYSLIG